MALASCDSPEERVQAHYERALTLMENGAPQKARLEFQNALKIDENHAPSRLEIAKLYEMDGEIQAAYANYQMVTELDPTSLPAWLKLAQYSLLGNNLEQAERASAEALKLAPEDPEALTIRAATLMRADKADEGEALARKALAQAPGYTSATLLLAQRRLDSEDLDGALELVQKSLEVNDSDVALHMMHLQILGLQDDSDAVIAQLERMTAQFPEERGFSRALAQVKLRSGDSAGARALFEALANDDPNDLESALDMVRFANQSGGTEAAIEAFDGRIAAATDPEAAARLRLARAEFEIGANRPEDARATLNAVITEDAGGQGDAARVLLASVLFERLDQSDEARGLVNEVLARDPQNAQALTLRAALFLEEQEADKALADLRVAADLDPENARIMLLMAEAYNLSGNPDLAADRLASAARNTGFAPDVAIAYARFLERRDQRNAARLALEEALERRPDESALLFALTELEIRDGDWDKVAELTQRLEESGSGTAALALSVNSLEAQGKLDESAQLLEGLPEETRAREQVFVKLVTLYMRSGEAARAEALVAERLEANPADAAALMMRAEMQVAGGDPEAADQTLLSLIENDPALPAGYLARARLALGQGRPDGAKTILRDGIADGADAAPMRLMLAQVLEAEGAFDAAIAEYAVLFEAQPNSAVVANNYASLLADHNANDPQALALASQVAQRLRGSTVPQFLDTYGWIEHLNGRSQSALTSLLPAAEALPNNPWVRYHAGVVLEAIGQSERARGHLTALLEFAPDFPKAADARAMLEKIDAAAQQ